MIKADSREPTFQPYQDIFHRTQVEDFLVAEGVAIAEVKDLAVDRRPIKLIQTLFTADELNNLPPKPSLGSRKTEQGLIVVKPETLPFLHTVEKFLENIGLEPNVLATKFLTKPEWLTMYGYMLPTRPEIVNTYITQRSLGMTAISFDHLPARSYIDQSNGRGDLLNPSLHDINTVFDTIFCGLSAESTPGTLRWDTTRKNLAGTAFATMTDDASVFDPVDYYKDGHLADIFWAFNGIHVPSNNAEAYQNIGLFSDNG